MRTAASWPGRTTLRRRLQAAAARGLTRFVGRQHKLEALRQALSQEETGHGQVAALVGETGVGKSRLAYEFVHALQTQGWLVLESTSVSYDKATPYFPVLDLLKRYCHREERDNPRTVQAKVTGGSAMVLIRRGVSEVFAAERCVYRLSQLAEKPRCLV